MACRKHKTSKQMEGCRECQEFCRKPHFYDKLQIEAVSDCGSGQWRLTQDLNYQSDVAGLISVPMGFVTDFASVPRLPLVFLIAGDTAHRPATVHDWLYRNPSYKNRELCDQVFLEAMLVVGVPKWRAKGMYYAVRMFGGLFKK